jgi:hypothetical protein
MLLFGCGGERELEWTDGKVGRQRRRGEGEKGRESPGRREGKMKGLRLEVGQGTAMYSGKEWAGPIRLAQAGKAFLILLRQIPLLRLALSVSAVHQLKRLAFVSLVVEERSTSRSSLVVFRHSRPRELVKRNSDVRPLFHLIPRHYLSSLHCITCTLLGRPAELTHVCPSPLPGHALHREQSRSRSTTWTETASSRTESSSWY